MNPTLGRNGGTSRFLLIGALALGAIGCGRRSTTDPSASPEPRIQGGSSREQSSLEPARCDEEGTFGDFEAKATRRNAIVRGLPTDPIRAAAVLEETRAREGLLVELNGVPNPSVVRSMGGHIQDTEISDATYLFRGSLTPPNGPGIDPQFDVAYEGTATNAVEPIRAWPTPSGATPVALEGDELVVEYRVRTVCSSSPSPEITTWLSIRSDGSFRVRPPQPVGPVEDLAGPGAAIFEMDEAPTPACARLRPFRRSGYAVCAKVPAIDVPGARRLIFWQFPMT